MNPFKTLHLFLFEKKQHVCPTGAERYFDNRLRNWLVPPEKLYGDLIQPGMTVVDLGAGGGVNTYDAAVRVGESGKVIAVDIQQGMLDTTGSRIAAAGLADRVELHLSEPDSIGLPAESADFLIASMVMHEVPDREAYLRQIYEAAKPGAAFLIIEPPVHVSKGHFEETLRLAQRAGFSYEGRRKVPVIHTAVLRK